MSGFAQPSLNGRDYPYNPQKYPQSCQKTILYRLTIRGEKGEKKSYNPTIRKLLLRRATVQQDESLVLKCINYICF